MPSPAQQDADYLYTKLIIFNFSPAFQTSIIRHNEMQKKKNMQLKGYIYYKYDKTNKIIMIKNGNQLKKKNITDNLIQIYNSNSTILKIKTILKKYSIGEELYDISENEEYLLNIVNNHIIRRMYDEEQDNKEYDYYDNTNSDYESDIEINCVYKNKNC